MAGDSRERYYIHGVVQPFNILTYAFFFVYIFRYFYFTVNFDLNAMKMSICENVSKKGQVKIDGFSLINVNIVFF